MNAHHSAQALHQGQDVKYAFVRYAKRVVSQVQFEGADTRAEHLLNFRTRALIPVGNRHMKGVIARATAIRLGVPRFKRVREGVPPVLRGEVHHGGGAANQRGARAGGEIIRRNGDAVIHVKMRMPVDEAGKNQQTRRVQHLVSRLGINAGAKAGDFAALHAQVGVRNALLRNQRAVLNEQHARHLISLILSSAARIRAPSGPPVAVNAPSSS